MDLREIIEQARSGAPAAVNQAATNAAIVDASFRRAQRQNLKDEAFLRQAGLEPPQPEDGESLLWKTLDALDTGGQFVRGAIASQLGVEGFEGKGLVDAALAGNEQDLTTGELMRRTGVLQDKGLAPALVRGGLSFLGDVATDPLSFISITGKGASRIAGQALSDAPILTKTGEKSLSTIADDYFKRLAAPIEEAFAAGKIDARTKSKELAKAWSQVEDPFRVARELAKQEKQLQSSDAAKLLTAKGEVDPFKIEQRLRKKVLEPLEIDQVIRPGDLFSKRGVRFSSLIPGFGGNYLNWIPLVTTPTRNADIPLVTKASERLIETLGGKAYNAKVRVENVVDNAIRKLEQGGAISRGVATATGALAKVPKVLSRKLQVGSKAGHETLLEHEAARKIARANVLARTTALSEGLDRGHRESITAILETADDAEFRQRLASAMNEADLRVPGSAGRLREAAETIRADYKRLAEIEEKEGVLGAVRDAYIRHAYEPAQVRLGMSDEGAYDKLRRAMDGMTVPAFDRQRKYATYEDAVLAGLKPKYDAIEMYAERLYQHELGIANKRFLERLSYEVALPRSTYDKLVQMAQGQNEAEARAAIEELRRRGLKIPASELGDPQRVAELVEREGFSIFRNPDTGDVISPSDYDYLMRRLRDGGGESIEELRDYAQRIGFTFQPGERERVQQGFEYFRTTRDRLLGRAGEALTDRAGATTLPDGIKGILGRLGQRFPDDADFFSGVLPQQLVDVVTDSFNGLSTLDRALSTMGKDNPVRSALQNTRDLYIGWMRLLKLFVTGVWPGYLARNLAGSQLMTGQGLSLLGDSLNLGKIIQYEPITRGQGKLIQEGTGRIFDAKELNYLAEHFHVRAGHRAAADLAEMYQDVLGSYAGLPPPKRHGPVMSTVLSIADKIENFGREFMFYELVRQGNAPETAARITNETLIDYARGKTPFERDILNNLFFFYTFPKSYLANSLTAMVTKPGALTSQLHAINGVAELMRDPEAAPLPEDIDKHVNTLRGQEVFRKYLGRTKEGIPEFLTSVGLPIEEIARYGTIKVPDKLTPWNIIEAAGQNARRTAQLGWAQVNPLVRFVPDALVFNRNTFFDRPLDDPTLRRIRGLETELSKVLGFKPDSIPGRVVDTLPAFVRGLLGMKKQPNGDYIANPWAMATAMYLVPGASRAINTYNVAANKNLETDSRVSRVLGGARATAIDVGKSLVYDRREQLEEFMRREGIPQSRRKRAEFLNFLRQQEEED